MSRKIDINKMFDIRCPACKRKCYMQDHHPTRLNLGFDNENNQISYGSAMSLKALKKSLHIYWKTG